MNVGKQHELNEETVADKTMDAQRIPNEEL